MKNPSLKFDFKAVTNYRKRGSASYIVREVHSVRERERDTERERERERRKWRHHCRAKINWRWVLHFSLPKMCTLVLAKSFALFPAKKFAPQFFPLLIGAEFTLSVAKSVALFETVRILRTVAWRDWQAIETAKQTIEFPAARYRSSLSSKKSKKWIKLIPKTIGNRKRDCAWGCAWGMNTTWENLQIEKHKSGRRSFRSPNWFVLFDLQIFSGGVYSQKICTSVFPPLDWRWVHTLRCQKRCTFRNSSHSSHCHMAWLTGDRSSKANDRISGCTVPFFFIVEKIEKMNQINTKNYWK